MILKNLSRASKPGAQKQLINYILRYSLDEKKQLDKSNTFIVTHNLQGRTIEEYVTQFVANEANRIHKSVKATAVHHTILSFSPDDSPKITDDMLRAIAQQFIKLRGEENLYLFAKHENTNAVHMHCCVSGSAMSGRSSRMSNKEFATLKVELDRFQKQRFPELSASLPRHGLSKQAIQQDMETIEVRTEEFSQTEIYRKVIEVSVGITTAHQEIVKEVQSFKPSPYFKPGELDGNNFDEHTKYKLSREGFNEMIRAEREEAKEREEVAELKELASIRARPQELEKDIDPIREINFETEITPQEWDEDSEEDWSFEDDPDIANEY